MAQPVTSQDAFGLASEPMRGGTIAPRAFIAEQSPGSLLRNTLALYRSNFRPLFLAYVLPTYPLLVLQTVADESGNLVLFIPAALLGSVVSFIAVAALTVIISDICLGNVPQVGRAYARILKGGCWLRLLWTGFLQMILWSAGFLLLVIPGIILMIRLLACSTVVVLEGESGTKAIKRSLALTKGHFWRLFAVLGMLSLMVLAAVLVISVPIGIGAALLGSALPESHLQLAVTGLLGALIQGIFYPMIFITIVLVYYDLRARKEAYDVAALAEDMMR